MRAIEGDESPVLEHQDEFCQVYADGRIEYTQQGVRTYGPFFRDHGIDIRTIVAIQVHCDLVSECIHKNLGELLRFQMSTDPVEQAARGYMQMAEHARTLGVEDDVAHQEAMMFEVLGLSTDPEKERFRRIYMGNSVMALDRMGTEDAS